MPEPEHGEEAPVPKFCVVRKPNQGCGCSEDNNYIKDNPTPSAWTAYRYTQTALDKETGEQSLRVIASQAHHIVCCSSAQKLLAAEEQVKRVVETTQWCVNKKINIKRLPLWGNTLKYYCTISSAQWTLKRLPQLPPPFLNLPQHDSDHPRYTKEVNIDIGKLEKQLKKKAKAHQLTAEKVAGALDSLAKDKWEPELTTRGMRCSGTHEAWRGGKSGKKKDWYLPFSMTTTSQATKRTFPLAGSDSTFLDKLAKMSEAVKLWGF